MVRAVTVSRPHNFVEYPKAGREGKFSTLPAQAVTGSIMCTLAAPGCQRAKKMYSGSPRLSKGAKSPQVIRESKRCMHSDSPKLLQVTGEYWI